MRARFGHGGWVGIDGIDLPGPLYLRVSERDGRLRITEFYLDASTGTSAIDLKDLRQIPLAQIEAFINVHADQVRKNVEYPAPDLSTLASYYRTGFGQVERQIAEGNWVVASFVGQSLPPDVAAVSDPEKGVRVKRMPRARLTSSGWQGVRKSDREYRLASGPTDGVTDDFLRQVARAYEAAVLRGEKPNVAIAEQTGYPLKSAQRWVYTARQRGIMPRGQRGKAG